MGEVNFKMQYFIIVLNLGHGFNTKIYLSNAKTTGSTVELRMHHFISLLHMGNRK